MQYEEAMHLLSGEVNVVSREQCDTTHNKITSTTICAGPYHINGYVCIEAEKKIV